MSKIIRDMIKKRVGSMVVLGSIFSFTLSASAEEVLTWEDCVREAKKNHPDLASAAELMRQARTDEYINLSDIFPQITSSAEGARGMPSGGKTHNSYSWDVTGQQLLFDGFKTSSEVSNAFKIFKAQEYNYAVVSSNIRLDLRSAFAGLLRAQELVSLTEDIASRRRENLNLVKLRYEAGREHRGALLTADADLAQAEFEVAQAIRNVSLAQRQLTKELGRSVKKPIKAEGTFAASGDYNTTPDFENLAESTPFLRELIVRKEAARYDVLSEESDFFPQVYLDTSFGRSGTTFMPRDEGWSAGVSVSLPLFEGGSRLAEVFKTKSQYRQAKSDERSGRDSVLVVLEEAWKGVIDAIAKVGVQKKFVEATEERARIANTQYSTGLISFDDWIIIENDLVLVKKTYLDAEAAMMVAEATWIQAIGGTLEYDKR